MILIYVLELNHWFPFYLYLTLIVTIILAKIPCSIQDPKLCLWHLFQILCTLQKTTKLMFVDKKTLKQVIKSDFKILNP